MAKQKTPTLAQVCAILDHDRCEVGWLLAAYADPQTGLPRIDRITRIGIVRPRDGAGRLKVCATDWATWYLPCAPTHYLGQAGGYGYDKLTAALDGATIAGRVVSDHSRDGTTWKQWIDRLQSGHATEAELQPIRLHFGLAKTAPIAFHFVGGF